VEPNVGDFAAPRHVEVPDPNQFLRNTWRPGIRSETDQKQEEAEE
jgi:hypothetical protein